MGAMPGTQGPTRGEAPSPGIGGHPDSRLLVWRPGFGQWVCRVPPPPLRLGGICGVGARRIGALCPALWALCSE